MGGLTEGWGLAAQKLGQSCALGGGSLQANGFYGAGVAPLGRRPSGSEGHQAG